jgi:hypothetical protein
MFVNVVNKYVLFYFILFGLLAQWEGETNNCESWPSKIHPIKNNESCSEEDTTRRCKEKWGMTIAEIRARRRQPA